MDLKKLKIDKFNRFLIHNFPAQYKPKINSVKSNIEVILYYIDSVSDVADFVKLCESSDLAKNNRVIMIFNKGRKDGVNRNSIFAPFKNGIYSGFTMKREQQRHRLQSYIR